MAIFYQSPRNSLRSRFGALVLACGLWLPVSTVVAAPSFNYGGRLAKADGSPVTGPVDLEVRFYDASTAGNVLGASVYAFPATPLSSGVFEIEIAPTASEMASLFPDPSSATWIEITDKSNNRTYPRQKFSAVPYALKVPVDNTTVTFDSNGRLTVKSASGSASGSVDFSQSAAVTGTLTVRNGGTGVNLAATGGSGQYLQQTTAGGVVSVGSIPASDLPNHSAALITSGTIGLARGGTGADLSGTGGSGQYLKQNSAGGAVTVGAIASGDVPWDSPGTIGSTTANTGAFTTLSSTGGTNLATSSGNVGIGTTTANAKLYVYGGQIAAAPSAPGAATVDFNQGNIAVVASPGGSAITLNNMVDGAAYSVIITDTTSRTYTFTNCTNSHFSPANAATTAASHSVYTIIKVTIAAATHCYISWLTGM